MALHINLSVCVFISLVLSLSLFLSFALALALALVLSFSLTLSPSCPLFLALVVCARSPNSIPLGRRQATKVAAPREIRIATYRIQLISDADRAKA